MRYLHLVRLIFGIEKRWLVLFGQWHWPRLKAILIIYLHDGLDVIHGVETLVYIGYILKCCRGRYRIGVLSH